MANDVGIRVGIEGEKQFRDSLKGINSQLKNLNTELDASAQKFKNSANSEEALEEKTDILSRTIDAQKKKIELLTTQYDNQIKKLSVLGDELDKVSEEFGKNSDQAAKAQNAYNRQATQVNNLGSQLNTAKSDLSRFEEQMRTASDRSIRFSEDLKSAASKLDKFSSKASSIGNTLTLGVTTPILGAGLASFKYASDLEENLNKTEVAFKENSDEVIEWSKTTLKQYGLSQSTALNMASTWGDMGTSMGIPLDTATEMSKTLVGLSADLASFKNISIDRAQTALNAVYTGETESLKELGVVMTEANLEAYAMAKGTEKSYKEMDQAEKVSLRYQYVLDKTQNSQGDFARTSDSAANQMRIAQESAKELAAEFGKKLLPAGTKILEFANDLLDSFNNLDDGTQNLIISIAGIAAAAGPATKLLGGITGVAGKVAGGIGGLVGKIKDLNTVQKGASGSASILKNVLGNGAVGLLGAVAIGVGIWGVYATKQLESNNESFKAIKAAQDLREEIKNSNEEIQQNTENRKKSIEEIINEADQQKFLADRLFDLSEKQTISNTEYAQMEEIVRQLNEQIPNMNLAIDDQTGKLSLNREEVDNLIESNKKLALQQAAKTYLDDIAEDMITSQKSIYDLNQELEDLIAQRDEAQKKADEYQGVWGKTQEYQTARNEVRNLTLEIENQKKEIENTKTTLQESEKEWEFYEDVVNGNIDVMQIANSEIGNTSEEMQKSLDESRKAIANSEGGFISQLTQLSDLSSQAYANNLDFYGPTTSQISTLQSALSSSEPLVAQTASAVASAGVSGMTSTNPEFQKAGSDLIKQFADAMAMEEGEAKEKALKVAWVSAAMLNVSDITRKYGEEAGESWSEGFESAVNTIGNTVASILSSNPNSWSRQSYSPAVYSMAKMAPASASLMKAPESDVSLFSSPIESSDPAPMVSLVKRRVAPLLDINDSMYEAGMKMANSIERGIRANIMPERQEISVVMPSGSTGTTLNQTNNFYSPEALSPAETARLNRVNVRRTIQALR